MQEEIKVPPEMEPHTLKLTLSDETQVKLAKAAFLFRRYSQYRGMPSMSEVVEWIISTCPVDAMWDSIYGQKTSIQAEEEVNADVLSVSPENGQS